MWTNAYVSHSSTYVPFDSSSKGTSLTAVGVLAMKAREAAGDGMGYTDVRAKAGARLAGGRQASGRALLCHVAALVVLLHHVHFA